MLLISRKPAPQTYAKNEYIKGISKEIPLYSTFYAIRWDFIYQHCKLQLLTTPQASFSPAFPDGCVVKSSGFP